MDRAAWLSQQVNYFMEHGRLPPLLLPGDRGFTACEMVMVSESKSDPTRLDFSAHWPDATLTCFRRRQPPAPKQRKPPRRPRWKASKEDEPQP
jgi:hypothetical protein